VKKRVVSGMRPTGKLHLGHLVGALRNWVELQDAFECFYFVADWHALTSEYADTTEITASALDNAADWIAAGVDPEKSTLFIQSMVPEHAELHLLLSMIAPTPWLERVPTYKEQQEQVTDRDLATYGFLGYPLLQTADVVIYNAHAVPVGDDQVPHLELSREIVRRFNRLYGQVLVEPQALLSEASLIPGSDGRKMSKSFDNAIGIRDEPDEIRAKVRTFVTDPQKVRMGDPGRPEICPVFALHKTYSPDIVDWTQEHCRIGDLGCVDCKTNLADHLIEYFRPFRERRAELAADPGYVEKTLAEGADKVRPIMQETLAAVRAAMHFA